MPYNFPMKKIRGWCRNHYGEDEEKAFPRFKSYTAFVHRFTDQHGRWPEHAERTKKPDHNEARNSPPQGGLLTNNREF